MKKILVVLSFGLMVLSLSLAYFISIPFWQSFAISAAASFLALGVGLIFVNIYLERKARKGAVKSLLILSHRTIADFHNTFLDLCWAKYGKDKWGDIGLEYIHSNGDPSALRQEVRDTLYDLAKSNKELMSKLDRLQETLVELARLVGWDLDARLLEACLDSRIAIGRLKELTYDDSDSAKSLATKYLMDADIHSQTARSILMSIAGISED